MKERSDKSLLRPWANSYTRTVLSYVTALISAIVILSAGASYLVVRNETSKRAGERMRLDLQRTAASFSTMFASSIIPASEQMFETPEVNNLIYGSKLTPQELITASQLLDRFQLSNPLIASIEVYNSQRSTIYSTRFGVSDASSPGNAALMRIFRRINDFRLYRFIPRIVDGKRLLTVILGSRPYTGVSLLGGLVVNVDESAIATQLTGRLNDGSRIAVLDTSGTILFDTQGDTFGTDAVSHPIFARVAAVSLNSGSFTVPGADGPSLVSYYREPQIGWVFISSMPERLLFAGIARWRNEIILVFTILLVVSLVIGLSTTGRASLPLRRLTLQARSLQAELSVLGTSAKHKDDLSLVSETMELLNQRLHDLSQNATLDGHSLTRSFGRAVLDQPMSDDEISRLRRILFDSTTGEVSVLVA
ncbi:MAG TPA: cache domain-containing protein, partial [Spirochaetia bacterium]|nr:cache domain-containing protein [Spirochaetia bacterium]